MCYYAPVSAFLAGQSKGKALPSTYATSTPAGAQTARDHPADLGRVTSLRWKESPMAGRKIDPLEATRKALADAQLQHDATLTALTEATQYVAALEAGEHPEADEGVWSSASARVQMLEARAGRDGVAVGQARQALQHATGTAIAAEADQHAKRLGVDLETAHQHGVTDLAAALVQVRSAVDDFNDWHARTVATVRAMGEPEGSRAWRAGQVTVSTGGVTGAVRFDDGRQLIPLDTAEFVSLVLAEALPQAGFDVRSLVLEVKPPAPTEEERAALRKREEETFAREVATLKAFDASTGRGTPFHLASQPKTEDDGRRRSA